MSNPAPPARGGSLWALVAGTFVVETGAFLVIPVLPLYLRGRGVDLATVGLIVGSTYVVSFLAQYPAGRLADRFGRRRFLIAGALLFALANAGFVLPLPVPGLLALRLLQGLGIAAFFPSATALVADLSAPARRGRAYGWLQAARIAGLTAGPAIGGIVALLGRSVVFEATGALELVAALMLALTIPAHLRHVEDPVVNGIDDSAHAVAALRRRQRLTFVGVAALMSGFTFLFGSYATVWPLFMRGLGASDAMVGISFSAFGLPLLVVTPLAGWLADHFDRKKLALIGYAGGGICAPLYPLVRSIPLILVIGVVEASLLSLSDPATSALVMEDVPASRRASVQGGIFSIQSAAEAGGALSGGFLFSLGAGVPFFAGAGLGFIGLLVALVAFAASRRPSPQHHQ
ncbi:MAG: transporter, family, multidrug resistance protein [Chloroflexota bacterium]|jgi:DHA1 family multidrug resistance protein-like MFS transporter|nr:transporter, family, multidrug resistance protein [Chloroflexota bacterium]